MKKYLLGGLAAAGLLLGGLTLNSGGIAVADQEVCADLWSGTFNTTGNPLTVTVTAPAGYLIDRYCVKAGSEQSVEDGAVVYVDVVPPAQSVTISHPSGKAVSHYSYSKVMVQTTTTTTTTPTTTTTTLPPTTTAATTTTTTTAATTTTVAALVPTTAVGQSGPVPPAVVPAAPVAPAAVAAPAAVPTQLPSTGSSSWGTAMLALAALLGGLGLVKLSRRSS